MKGFKSTSVAVVLAAVLGLLWSGRLAAQRPLHPGAEPFTPTRIDWLIVELQACCRYDSSSSDGFDLQFTHPDPETVLIYVTYLPTVNREAMNIAIDSARKVIDIKAKSYGWQTWVRVREDVHLGKGR